MSKNGVYIMKKWVMIGLLCLVVLSVFITGCSTNAAEDTANTNTVTGYASNDVPVQRAPQKSMGTGHQRTCY